MQELGESTTRQITRLANGKIPYHKSHAKSMNGVEQREEAISFSQFP